MIISSRVDFFWATFFTVLEMWSFFFSVIGNSIVIFVMTREKKLRRKSNFYVISVAFADLLMGVFAIPFSVYLVKWNIFMLRFCHRMFSFQIVTGGPKDLNICLSFVSFVLANSAVSIFSLVAVSINRFCAIFFPIAYHNNTKKTATKLTIFFCWALGTIGLFPVLGWNSGIITKNKCDSRDFSDFNYLIFFCCFVWFIPALSIVCIYALIYKKITALVRKHKQLSVYQIINIFENILEQKTIWVGSI